MSSTPEDLSPNLSANEAASQRPTETFAAREPAGSRGEPEFVRGELLDGRFRIVRAVGRGGMGTVYEAIDEKLTRRVAVKCARARYSTHLRPEVRNASEVSHPNVCRIFEIHTAYTRFGELDFISMEYLEGETLARRLRKGPIRRSERLAIGRQLAAGLAEAHRNRVIHGDIKSNNVILTAGADGSVRAVITDFGLARSHGVHPRAGGGTPGYMASELWRGAPTSERSDIYALGVVLFELAYGRQPWRQPSRQPSRQPRKQPSPQQEAETDWEALSNQKLPVRGTRWDKILDRCLDPDPLRRYRDATELLDALGPSRARRRGLAIVAAAVLATATGFVTYRNATALPDTVKLALLPFAVEGPAVPSAAGIAEEIARRVSGSRRQFTVYAPSDLQRRSVASAESAHSALGATHALKVIVKTSDSKIQMRASLIDLASGRSVGELSGEYSPADASIMARALIGIVAGAFHLKQAATRDPVSAAAYAPYVQGTEFLRRDSMNPDPAIPLLEKAVSLDPRSADALAELAAAQVDEYLSGGGKDWLDRAGQSVAAARRLDPDSMRVLLASGLVQQQRGSYEAAIRDFTRATEQSPATAEAWRHLAVAYDNSNRSAEAASAYRKAIEVEPEYYRPHLDFGNFYYYRADFPAAEREWRRAVSLAPQVPAARMNLGLALLQQEKLGEAEDSVLQAVRLRKTPDALMNLGVVYYRERKFSDAVGSFESSLKPGNPTALQYRNLGDALRQLGRTADAGRAYRKALALAELQVAGNPRQAFSRANLGYLAARTGDRRRAESEVAQAIAIEPENASVLREGVITSESVGNRRRALELLAMAPPHLVRELSHNPDVPGLRNDPRFIELLKASERR